MPQAQEKIVKVQLPVATSETEPLALIYGRGHMHMVQMVPTAELKAVMGHRKKAFMRGTWDGEKWTLDTSKLLPDENW